MTIQTTIINMKILLTTLLLLSSSIMYSQVRILQGKIIDDIDLQPIPGVYIQTNGKIIGKTENNGSFQITIPDSLTVLEFSAVGMETTCAKITKDCNVIELIMMYSWSDCFISSKKSNKLKLRRFNKLNRLRKDAYQKGIFTMDSVCYEEYLK